MERGEQVLALGRAILATFSSSEWTEIGYLTCTDQYINKHHRLLRSLYWGDEDYKEHVFDAVAYILDFNESNLKRLTEYESITSWLNANDSGTLHSLQSEIYGTAVPEVMPAGSQAALLALADAQALLKSRGPASAVDRVHTGLHGFLKGACAAVCISSEKDATPNQLLKLLLNSHPALQDLGPRGQAIRTLIRSSASLIDTMGTLRNHASMAHPNEDLLDYEEALLAINLVRSLLRFLDAKLNGNRD